MCNSWARFALILMFIAGGAQARSRFDFVVKKSGGLDLVNESRVINLASEASVQRDPSPPHRSYAIFAGGFRAQPLQVESISHNIQYDLSMRSPLVSMVYSDFVSYWHGQWGWQAGLGYGQIHQGRGQGETTLHILPSHLSLSYRMRDALKQRMAPMATLGISNFSYFQRGGDAYNTSASRWGAVASAGAVLNLSEMAELDSPIPFELTLVYQKYFDGFSGDAVSAGVGLSL